MDIVIRKAEEADVETIVRMANAGGPEGNRETLPEVLPGDYSEAFRRIVADPKQFLMVVEYGGVVIGTFHVTYLTYLMGGGRDDCQIEAVHVAEGWRNHGIGSRMLTWVIEEAKRRNCRRVQLTTDKRRKEAQRFYQRLGFVLTHEGAKLVL